MNGRNAFLVMEPIIIVISFLLKIMPGFFLEFLFNLSSGIPTKVGVLLRYIFIKQLCKSVGRNVYIGRYVTIKNFDKLSLGDNVSIHEYCYIDGIGGIIIGSNVSIAHASSIISFNHTYENIHIAIKYNELEMRNICIRNDVWIGCGVRILAGTIINERTVVGAGTILNDHYPSSSLIVGIPGRVIKDI